MTSEGIYSFNHYSPKGNTEANYGVSEKYLCHIKAQNDSNPVIEYVDEELDESMNMEVDIFDVMLDSDDGQNELMTQRRWWTRSETLALIQCVDTQYRRIKDPETKRRGWNNVASSLEQRGIHMTEKDCSVKWRNLMRSYIRIKRESKQQPVSWIAKFEYFHEMDNVITKYCKLPQAPRISSLEPTSTSTLGTGTAGDVSSTVDSTTSSKVEESKTRCPARKLSKRVQRLRSKRYLARIRNEWRVRQQEWEHRHVEKQASLQLYKQKLDLRAQKLELLDKYITNKEIEISKHVRRCSRLLQVASI